jgi:membrane associated rhomboid family serine protease
MRDLPLITKILLAINVVIFVANQFGALPYTVAYPGVYSLGTFLSHFSHASLMHLASNGIGIFMISPLLERMLGAKKYVIFLLFLWLAQVAILPQILTAPTLGFSGILMGMFTYLALKLWWLEPGNPLRMFGRDLLVLVGINLATPLLIPQISFLGHAIGALLGLVAISLAEIFRRRK